jgi:hypothetical protein
MFKRPSSAELPKTDDLSGDHWNRKHTSVITKVTDYQFGQQICLIKSIKYEI